MLTSADIGVITRIAKTIVKETIANTTRGDGGLSIPVAAIRTGIAGTSAPPGATVSVRLDGDAGPVDAINALPITTTAGVRVVVAFPPPHGIYIIGSLGGGTGASWQSRTSNAAGSGGWDLPLSLAVDVAPGAALRIEGFANMQAASATSGGLYIYQDSSIIGSARMDMLDGNPFFFYVTALVMPTSGMHTYKLRFNSGVSSTLVATAAEPAYLIVTHG